MLRLIAQIVPIGLALIDLEIVSVLTLIAEFVSVLTLIAKIMPIGLALID